MLFFVVTLVMIIAFIEYIPPDQPYTSTSNTYNHTYYAPELRLIVERYRSLEHNKEALDRFIQQQQILATQLMEVRAWLVVLHFQSELVV